MSDWVWIVLGILASYRIARILAVEEGPFGVLDAIRNRLDPKQETWLGRGLNCPLCAGFWVSLAVSLVLLPWSDWRSLCLTWFAVAGGMAALHLWLEK